MRKINVLLLGTVFDGTDLGESREGFRFAQALARRTSLTILALQPSGRMPLKEQLPEAEVVTWPAPDRLRQWERLNAMLKPSWPIFFSRARAWLHDARSAGRHFDIAHQVLPAAPRYPTPLSGGGIPYVIGPVGGSLETPKAFRAEVGKEPWFTRLRGLDKLRFSYDPWLRASFGQAEVVLGVAPYMRTVLQDLPIKRFEPFLRLAVDAVPVPPKRMIQPFQLKLLHVGRAVRSKGLRDSVRALAHLRDMPEITLTSAGSGEEVEICKAEAAKLGVEDRVRFLGAIPRESVERLYAEHDVFIFPSFRESMGAVLLEAMRWGLPVITVNVGGPDWIVSSDCGIKVTLATPEKLACDIADAIRQLASDPSLLLRLGQGAYARATAEGCWEKKIERVLDIYNDVISSRRNISHDNVRDAIN